MCLIFLAMDAHPRYRLIVAANRDEYHARATAPLCVWPRGPGGAEIVAGRDLVGDGTWMGVTRRGRFAALTNYRGAAGGSGTPPTRGKLVRGFLESSVSAGDYTEALRADGYRYNGFSLLVHDGEECYCYSNRPDEATRLGPGLHGLSNHLLNSPWPKVSRGIGALERYLAEHDDPVPDALFDLLTDPHVPGDHELPDTGVGVERGRALAPRFGRGVR
jgi:uncharacterized protein with NRDE domain